MGNDGGSIPKRRELVKEAARNKTVTELKETQHEQQEYYWSTDPITQKPLIPPIVSDASGKLYNKDTILEYLLPSDDASSKTETEKVLQGAVKSLKDVVEVKFETDAENSGKKQQKWICPMTHKALGAGTKSVYLVPCGHAFLAAAVKEVSGERCLQCNEPYASNDIIPIIPTDAIDIARLELRTKTLREKGLTHSLKKAPGSKKRKKHQEPDGAPATEAPISTPVDANSNGTAQPGKHQADPAPATGTNIKNTSTASLTAKVLQEEEDRKKRRRLAQNENLSSLFSSRDPSKPSGRSADFMSRGFTIPAQQK